MRVAESCHICATYINAHCIIYSGAYLPAIDTSPLTSLDEILGNINTAFTALTGIGPPLTIPQFVGQLYIDTAVAHLYIGMGTTSVNWALASILSTTTSTTTTP